MDLEPLYGLRLVTPRLELRLPRRDEYRQLADLARRGVHPPDQMLFGVAWTDGSASPGFVDDYLRYQDQALASWSAGRWSLNFGVWNGATLIGSQGIYGVDFTVTRKVKTGSWLGQEFQRRGFGTEMRSAVLHLAFAGLGALEAESGAELHNVGSWEVSEKLGYVQVGKEVLTPRGVPQTFRRLRIDQATWSARPHVTVEIVGLSLEVVRLCGGAAGR